MGMPRILPMRKPDPRFMSRLMVSVAQEFDGSGEGRARCEPTRAPLRGVGRVRKNERVPPHPADFVTVANKGLAGYGTWKKVPKMGNRDIGMSGNSENRDG